MMGEHQSTQPASHERRNAMCIDDDAVRVTLLEMEKLMKLVSTSTWYGGPSAVLWRKKSAEETLGLGGRERGGRSERRGRGE